MRTDNALALISKHKQLIVVVIGVAAIASYMVPFANLFAVADAWSDSHKKVDFKKKKFDFKFIKFFKKIFKFQDRSTSITNSFNNFGVNQLFRNINSIDVYAGGTTTPTGGSIAINQGSNYFIVLVNNCPGGTTGGNCQLTSTIQIQNNPYLSFGGSV